MCILVCFVLMLFVNVCNQWTSELKNVEFLVGLVYHGVGNGYDDGNLKFKEIRQLLFPPKSVIGYHLSGISGNPVALL